MGCFQMRSTSAAAAAALVVAATSSLLILLLLDCEAAVPAVAGPSSTALPQQHQMRKLLSNSAGGRDSTERTSPDGCSEEDVVVYQNNAPHLSSGIPAYSVEIINVCAGCTVYDVHVACGDFASTELVNPAVFRRLAFDDCLVKGGAALGPGETVAFQYSNSFAYPFDVASVACN